MEPESIFDLTPQEFEGVIGELGLPQSEADQLRRQYRRQNSMFAGLYGLLDSVRGQDAEQGRVRAEMLPMTRPEGMTGMEALLSGEAQLALPGGLLGAAEGAAMGFDAPAAAYQGMIPAEDMAGEALGTAGMAMLGGGAVARPAGSVGMGGRVVDFEDRLLQQRRNEFLTRIQAVVEDVASGNYQRRLDEAALSFHREGLLPLQIGARVTPPSTWDMPGDWRVSGYYVDPNEPRRFGYRLESTTGDVYDAAVSDPQLGYALNDPTVFGGGFRAFPGPQRESLEYRNLPERSQTSPAPDVTQEDLDRINQEYSDLFGETISANRSTTTGAVGLLANEGAAAPSGFGQGWSDVYHWTRAEQPFSQFDPDRSTSAMSQLGPHVGTLEAAQARALGFPNETGQMIPLRANLRRPFLNQQTNQPWSEMDLEVFLSAMADEHGVPRQEIAPIMRGLLAQEGYTDIPYVNDVEDAGSISNIMLVDRPASFDAVLRRQDAAFDPARRTDPNLLAANASPSLGLLTASAPSEQEQLDQLDQLRAYLGLLAQ